jgi:hypothetical protein
VYLRKWGSWILIIVLGTVLPGGAGCACHRSGQGWVFQPCCWSLEFKRTPSACDGTAECNEGCDLAIPKEPGCASVGNGESRVLQEADPKQLEKLSKSPFARLMGRCGRLGICANCGQLARFKGQCAEEKPPEPVIARFVPVPTQPVFCPRDGTMQPVAYEQIQNQKPTGQESSLPVKKSQSKAPLPEEIPPPPNPSGNNQSGAAVPKQLSALQEQTSWIFYPPGERKPDRLIEAQLPPRPSERVTR